MLNIWQQTESLSFPINCYPIQRTANINRYSSPLLEMPSPTPSPFPIPGSSSNLKSRSSLSPAQRSAYSFGRPLFSTAGEDIAAHLAHALLLLDGQVLLLLGHGQGVGDADQQGADGDGPGRAAAEGQRRRQDVRGRLELVPEPGPGCRGDDVLQGCEALREGFAARVVVGVC
jgi:hypothetical protein